MFCPKFTSFDFASELRRYRLRGERQSQNRDTVENAQIPGLILFDRPS
jgi:hypothetical protein